MTEKLREYLADPNSYPAVYMYGADGKGGLWATRNVPAKYSELWLEDLPIEAENPQAYQLVQKYIGDIVKYVDEKKVGLFFFSKPSAENKFGTGTGKAQPLYSKVLTPNGYKKMGDIKLGDAVVDGEGNTTEVIGVYPQGKKPVYRVHLQDSTYIDVSDEHLNSVQYYDRHKKRLVDEILTTNELIAKLEDNTRYSRPRKYRIKIPVIDCWDENNLPVNPYVMGALLGDGGLSSDSILFTNSEEDIVEKMGILLSQIGYELRYSSGTSYRISRIDRKQSSQLKDGEINLHCLIKQLGLKGLSIDKHIPEMYLKSSIEQRTQLLQGLIDTDGYICGGGTVEYSTSSPQLSDDFTFLARSLGIRVTVERRSSGYTNNGEYFPCNTSYRHHLKIPKWLSFYSSKKHSERFKERQNEPIRRIDKIEYIGEEDCQCIMVESPCHTYITDNFTVTHNTSAAVAVLNGYLYERLRLHLRGEKLITDNPVYFLKGTELQTAYNSQFRGNFSMQEEASERYYSIKDRAKKVDLLVLDDIGTRSTTEAFKDELYELIDHRVSEELVTVFTSNVTLAEVAELQGDRIASRIEGATVAVPFGGKDFRRKQL